MSAVQAPWAMVCIAIADNGRATVPADKIFDGALELFMHDIRHKSLILVTDNGAATSKKPLKRTDMIDHIVPCVMILLCVAFALVATYAAPRGEWAVAVYPSGKEGAFLRAASVADEIVGAYPRVNGVLVRVDDEKNKQKLRRSGAWLFDPTGVPLCYKP